MHTLASQLAELSPQRKRELLTRAADFDLFPLSHGQERMWFLDRLRPGTPNYNMPGRAMNRCAPPSSNSKACRCRSCSRRSIAWNRSI